MRCYWQSRMASQSKAIPSLVETTVSSGNVQWKTQFYSTWRQYFQSKLYMPIFLWLVNLLLALFSAWETARVRVSQHPPSHHVRWMVCGVLAREHIFIVILVPQLTMVVNYVLTTYIHLTAWIATSLALPTSLCTE